MYYGNGTACNQENAADVWSNNYVGVWHLKETTGGADAIKDSTFNTHHGTTNGTPGYSQTGKVGDAIGFSGDDYINVTDHADLTFGLSDPFTLIRETGLPSW